MVVPHTKRLSANFKTMRYKHTSKETIPSRTSCWFSKDKDTIIQISGVVYRYKCDRVECDEEYIGGSARTFGEKFKEYLKALPIFMNISTSQAIILVWTTSAQWDGNHRTSLEL